MSIGIDTNISIGNILEIAVLAGGWIITVVKIDSRLKSVERDIKEVTTLTKWRERFEERMMFIRRDVDDLRRGKGFIQEELDGEYSAEGHRRVKHD